MRIVRNQLTKVVEKWRNTIVLATQYYVFFSHFNSFLYECHLVDFLLASLDFDVMCLLS